MLFHHLKLNRLLHETVAVSAAVVEDIPRVRSFKRAEILKRDQGIIQIILHDGFMEDPNVPRVVRSRRAELGFDPEATACDVGSLTSMPTVPALAMSSWRQRLLPYMIRNSAQAIALFGTPPDCVIILGMQIKLRGARLPGYPSRSFFTRGLCLGEGDHCSDKGKVGKALRKVPQHLAPICIVLFREKIQVVSRGKGLLKKLVCLLDAALPRQTFCKPEGAA
jgi:hypothetical protein